MIEFCAAAADVRGDYRYSLTRVWDDALPDVTFVLLNPSTADAERLDPTMRRCVGFARRDGFGGMRVVNLYAFRSPSPRVMRAAPDPVGPDNDAVLAAVTGTVVAGWGAGADRSRVAAVIDLLPPLRALGVTTDGHPRHPLYMRHDAPLAAWTPRSR